MKRLIAISFLAIFGGLVIVSQPIKAQEKTSDKKEKKVKVKTVKVENGKKVVFDTTFTVKGDEDVNLEKYGIVSDGEDVSIEVSVDSDGNVTKSKNVFVIKDDDGNVEISTDGEKTYSYTIGDAGKNGTIKWTDEDGNEKVIDLSSELKDMDIQMKVIQKELEDASKEFDISHEIILKDLENLDELKELKLMSEFKELEGLEELKNMKFISVPDAPDAPEFMFFSEGSGKVSDVELRDAGIKNKPNRLAIENIELKVDDGVIDLYFKLKSDGNPKVTVYNVYGDKVFSDKPEIMNDQYSIRINLSEKQHGTYYIMIVDGNSSRTEKVKL